MKQVIVNVPDKKMDFFLELLNSLGFSQTEDDQDIPEEQKELVRLRIKNAKKSDYLRWDDVKDNI
jgi:hypothetical protein